MTFGSISHGSISYGSGIGNTGDVCIRSSPSGASITLDGIPQIGKTTAPLGAVCTPDSIITGLIPGTIYTYEVNLPNYQPITGTFTAEGGILKYVDVGILVPLPVSFNIFPALAIGGLFGFILLGKKKCDKYRTKEECEKAGCQWKDGKCIEKRQMPKKIK